MYIVITGELWRELVDIYSITFLVLYSSVPSLTQILRSECEGHNYHVNGVTYFIHPDRSFNSQIDDGVVV